MPRRARGSRTRSRSVRGQSSRSRSRRSSERASRQARNRRRRSDSDAQTQRRPIKKRARAPVSDSESDSGYESDVDSSSPVWRTLEHNGPNFPPAYKRLPHNVTLNYNKRRVTLSRKAEEIAGFYAKLLGNVCTQTRRFQENFFEGWRKVMTNAERRQITELRKCDFSNIQKHYASKPRTKVSPTAKEKTKKQFGFCKINGHKERISNFTVEPPGIFIGRGNNPNSGKIKPRIRPEDVTINCSANKRPKAPDGQKWKEIIHDNSVSWLARWEDSITGVPKYIMLSAASTLKRGKDKEKFDLARDLGEQIQRIRRSYERDWNSEHTEVRQRGVAIFFLDKFALRVGNEKGADETDTVGCCSLRKEHITLYDRKNGLKWVVALDFLGKDSIRYQNQKSVPTRVYENLESFIKRKRKDDQLFDRLTPASLNAHLSSLMPGLTAKVIRTFTASNLLQKELDEVPCQGTVQEKISAYTRANREVALLCNHKRAIPKSFKKSIAALDERIERKEDEADEIERRLRRMDSDTSLYERLEAKLDKCKDAIVQLEDKKTTKDEGKDIALGTSKTNYLDPRITVAWCHKCNVPIEKVYSCAQREKFAWAIKDKYYKFRF